MTSYTVKIEIDMEGETPLEVTKKLATWLKESADTYIYDVDRIDDETGLVSQSWSVDLSEEDENAVCDNN